MRPSADRLQLVPQPPLPQVPGHRRRASGWRPGRPSCCRSSIFTSSSRSRRRSARLRCRTRRRSTASCSKPPPRPCGRSPPTRSTSGPRSASWPSSTPGARTCNIIPTSIASCRAAGSSPDGSRWVPCRPGFFLPVRVLSRVFRGKFLALLKAAFDRGKLSFHGKLADAGRPGRVPTPARCQRQDRMGRLRQAPVRRPGTGAEVPGPVHPPRGDQQPPADRLEDGEVTFHWKDYAARGTAEDDETQGRSSSSAGSSCTCCRRGSCESATTASWPTGYAEEKLELCRALLGRRDAPWTRRGRARIGAEGERRRGARGTRLPRMRRGPDGDHRDRSEPARSTGDGPGEPGAEPPSGRDRYVLNREPEEGEISDESPPSRPPVEGDRGFPVRRPHFTSRNPRTLPSGPRRATAMAY